MIVINNLIAYSTKNVAKVVALITAFLLVFVVFYAAKLTWLFLTPESQSQPWKSPSIQHQNGQTSAINFANFYWFGKPNAKTEEVVVQSEITDAPKTSLNMTLTGVVAAKDAARSMAIIEYQSKQNTYLINQKITPSRASVAEIHRDRVILKNNGKYETLMLDGFDYTKIHKNKESQDIDIVVRGPSKASNAKLAKTRAEILKDPGKIVDYISITPVSRKGKVSGYRLNPGRRPELFTQSGLKPRDLAIAINGYDLTDTSQSIRVMSELKNMKNIMITVERDGQLTDIEFALP